MRKETRNYILNTVFCLAFLCQGVSGAVLWLVVRSGAGRGYRGGGGECGSGSAFLFDRCTWLDIHDWTAVALLIMFAVHIVLHWRWIVCMTKS